MKKNNFIFLMVAVAVALILIFKTRKDEGYHMQRYVKWKPSHLRCNPSTKYKCREHIEEHNCKPGEKLYCDTHQGQCMCVKENCYLSPHLSNTSSGCKDGYYLDQILNRGDGGKWFKCCSSSLK